jgi:hypothetical protein
MCSYRYKYFAVSYQVDISGNVPTYSFHLVDYLLREYALRQAKFCVQEIRVPRQFVIKSYSFQAFN